MKIIFLDIDGVLNSTRSTIGGHHRVLKYSNVEDPYYAKYTKCTIDPVAVDLVNKILVDFDANIVLSSSHRGHFDMPNKLARIQEYLTTLGLHGDRCIDWTPRLYNCPRGLEIYTWLDKRFDVESYAILDDGSDMLPEQNEVFVQVDPEIGFSAADYRKVTKIFGREDTGQVFL